MNFIILSLAFSAIFATYNDDNKEKNVTGTVPFSLGTVSFKSDSVWTIGSQEWSDVVMATGCKKNDFKGYENGNYLADCRQNPGYGDLFSWEAVNQYKAQLCPNGWRVPTKEDFSVLDMELKGSGDGTSAYVDAMVRDKYLTVWGGTYGGYCYPDGTLNGQGSGAGFWSQSKRNVNGAFGLYFGTNGNAYPQDWYNKYLGFPLRCVR